MSEILGSPEHVEFLFAFDHGNKVKIKKEILDEIPNPDNVVGLINVDGKIEVAKTELSFFEVGEEIYLLSDGRIAKNIIPTVKGIEITD